MSPAQAEVDGEVLDGGDVPGGQWKQPGEMDVDAFISLDCGDFSHHG